MILFFIKLNQVIRFSEYLYQFLGEVYNIGTNFEICPLDTAKQLIRMYGLSDRESEFIQYSEDRKFSEFRYALDASKLHKLGWKPEILFEEGLKKTSKIFLF